MLALLAFNRTIVDTVTKDGVRGELNVAAEAPEAPRCRFPHGPAGIPAAVVPVRAAPQPPDGTCRRIPLGSGLRGTLRHPGLLCRRRCGQGRWVAPVGRWQPGGNRPRQRSDHHVQPPGGDCGQEGRLSSGGGSHRPSGHYRSSTGCHLHFETILDGTTRIRGTGCCSPSSRWINSAR